MSKFRPADLQDAAAVDAVQDAVMALNKALGALRTLNIRAEVDTQTLNEFGQIHPRQIVNVRMSKIISEFDITV